MGAKFPLALTRILSMNSYRIGSMTIMKQFGSFPGENLQPSFQMAYTYKHLIHIPNNNKNEGGKKPGILAGFSRLASKACQLNK